MSILGSGETGFFGICKTHSGGVDTGFMVSVGDGSKRVQRQILGTGKKALKEALTLRNKLVDELGVPRQTLLKIKEVKTAKDTLALIYRRPASLGRGRNADALVFALWKIPEKKMRQKALFLHHYSNADQAMNEAKKIILANRLAYNAVAAEYNRLLEDKLRKLIDKELSTMKAWVQFSFDEKLWKQAFSTVFPKGLEDPIAPSKDDHKRLKSLA